jgi:signal transduction histidine kinase
MLKLLRRSLLLQSSAILLATLLAILVSMQMLLQSTIIFRVFPWLLDRQAETVLALATVIEHSDAEARAHMLRVFSTDVRSATLTDSFPAGAEPVAFLDERFQRAAARTSEPIEPGRLRFRLAGPSYHAQNEPQGAVASRGLPALSLFETSVRLASGEVLVVRLAPLAILGHYVLWFVLLALIASAGISIACLQIAFRPLRRLESSAAAIGHTSRLEPVTETGPEDIRRVARALNRMQSRVQSLLGERSQMVAAVAHDIRTSLTHMKLRMETMEHLRDHALHGDIDQMERLVGDMMLYASAERPSTDLELVELGELVSELCAGLPEPIALDRPQDAFFVAADRLALVRALTNLIENARVYASGTEVSVAVEDGDCVIRVDDRGPGIPEEQLSLVDKPFFRGELSRNRATGGSGLGLSIARALLGAQGATLQLKNRKGGGLRAEVRFNARTRID